MGLFRMEAPHVEVGTAADGVGEVDPVEAYLDVRSRVLALVREERGDVAGGQPRARARDGEPVPVIRLGDRGPRRRDGEPLLPRRPQHARRRRWTRASSQPRELWLQSGEESLAHLAAVTGDPPLPELRTSAFYAVTTDGAFAGSIPHAELNEHPLLGLWAKGEGVRREVLRWTLKGAPEAYAP